MRPPASGWRAIASTALPAIVADALGGAEDDEADADGQEAVDAEVAAALRRG